MRLASVLLENLKNRLELVEIVPSSGGVFEVTKNDQLVFSKKALGRFPSDEEIKQIVDQA